MVFAPQGAPLTHLRFRIPGRVFRVHLLILNPGDTERCHHLGSLPFYSRVKQVCFTGNWMAVAHNGGGLISVLNWREILSINPRFSHASFEITYEAIGPVSAK